MVEWWVEDWRDEWFTAGDEDWTDGLMSGGDEDLNDGWWGGGDEWTDRWLSSGEECTG